MSMDLPFIYLETPACAKFHYKIPAFNGYICCIKYLQQQSDYTFRHILELPTTSVQFKMKLKSYD